MSRDMIKIGGIGAIICILSAIAGMVAIIMLWASPIDYVFAGSHIDFGSGIVWAVGIALISIGAFGLWKQYQKSLPLAIGIVGIVTLALCLTASILVWLDGGAITAIGGSGISLGGVTASLSLILENFVGVAGVVWLELSGVFLILLGVGLIKLREDTGVEKMARVTGVLTLITGATFCAIVPFGYLAPQVLTLISMILMAYVLFKAR